MHSDMMPMTGRAVANRDGRIYDKPTLGQELPVGGIQQQTAAHSAAIDQLEQAVSILASRLTAVSIGCQAGECGGDPRAVPEVCKIAQSLRNHTERVQALQQAIENITSSLDI